MFFLGGSRRMKTPARPVSSHQARLNRLQSRDLDSGETDAGENPAVGAVEDVAVFCRLRPLDDNDPNQERCVEVIDETTLQIVPPQSSRAFYNGKATQFAFKGVFDEAASQKTVFQRAGLPLVRELLDGKNGLLFTYGVTGSGKTHTMQGTTEDGGVMARAIDVIFNSVEERMVTRKFMLVPDQTNDFQINSVVDAVTLQQREMHNEMKASRGYSTRSNTSNPNLGGRSADDTKLDSVDSNCYYAVFISYCEIYNKYIYDLLEDTRDVVTGRPKLSSKILREDAHGNMYVHGATEIEVRSPKEALEAFYRGQKRRRVAETHLNHESSRSHSVFNIRLVRCSPAGEDEIDFQKPCVVSQLALVDLAGSERTNRTGNTGDRLREAGNINNSLMNLRNCIERLRENQKTGRSGNVPYRNDKLTHLFRNYFEGIGAVKMIVCVNPRVADYDETVNVLQFAEMAQEIEIERIDPIAREFAMTPARQRVHQAYQEAMNKANTEVDEAKLNPQHSPIYSLGPPFPDISSTALDDEEALSALSRYLEQRVATRNTLIQDHQMKQESFRNRLVEHENELIVLREENARLKNGWDNDKKRMRELESRLVNAESANTSLQRRVDAFCEAKVVLENELDEKELELRQQAKESHKAVRKLRSQLSQEQDKGHKRSFEEAEEPQQQFRGVGSRIAEMEARTTITFTTPKPAANTKKFRI